VQTRWITSNTRTQETQIRNSIIPEFDCMLS
jgi:hypothetical protein